VADRGGKGGGGGRGEEGGLHNSEVEGRNDEGKRKRVAYVSSDQGTEDAFFLVTGKLLG